MVLLERGKLWPLCGGRVIGLEMAWRRVYRGAFLPRSGEPRRIAFLAHATKSNRQIGIVLAAKLGTLTISDALAFQISFIRPGTAAMRSLRRAQFFPPPRRIRSPRRAGEVAQLQVRGLYHPGIAFEAATLVLRIGISPKALLALTFMVMPARGTTNWRVSRRNDGIAITTRIITGTTSRRLRARYDAWRRREPDWLAGLSFLPQSFAAVGPLVQDHKRLSRATGHIAA